MEKTSKYKITIEIIKESDGKYDSRETIYEQTREANINLMAIINAFNDKAA